MSGDPVSLFKALEDGNQLNAAEMQWLSKRVRCDDSVKRRKLDQRIKEYKYVVAVWLYERQGMSQYQAKRRVLDDCPDLNEETLKTYLRNWKKSR